MTTRTNWTKFGHTDVATSAPTHVRVVGLFQPRDQVQSGYNRRNISLEEEVYIKVLKPDTCCQMKTSPSLRRGSVP